MSDTTKQMDQWSGEFGQDYTDRNPHTADEMNRLYEQQFGITRTALNEEFLGDLDRSSKILEIGANVGGQLQTLQDMGFEQLYGIELQGYAVEKAKSVTKNVNLIQGTAFDVPFKDGFFDVVYTSGVLIHISPDDIASALAEIYRCTCQYVWGFEYYADSYTNVPYRGRSDLLWKTDFAGLYTKQFPDLREVKEKKVSYLTDENVDSMYLLEKGT